MMPKSVNYLVGGFSKAMSHRTISMLDSVPCAHCSMTLPTAPLRRPSSSVFTPDSLDSATRPVLATSRMPAAAGFASEALHCVCIAQIPEIKS